MTYIAAPDRYERIPYRRVGRSGLVLPALSLGLWHNFGDATPLDTQRALLRTAFDLGINHFDLANNYGPPYGSAEINFGRLLKEDFRAYRDELVISTKAGWDMWPGPYGQGGSSRKYLLASLDQSLARLGWTMWTSSIPTASTPTRPWRKPPAPWPARCSRARRCTWASHPIRRARPASSPRCCGSGRCRC